MQVSSWLCGLSLLIWAFRDPRFQDAEGFVKGAFCLPVSTGVALMVLGCASMTHLRKSALWFALALVGQAAALQMIDAGRLVRFQHYKPLDALSSSTSALLLGYLAAQSAFVFIGLRARRDDITRKISQMTNVWTLAGVGAIFLLSSAAVSRSLKGYLFELAFAGFVQTVNLANVVLIVLSIPDYAIAWLKTKSAGIVGPKGSEDVHERSVFDRFALLAAIWVIALGATLSYFSYERYPHLQDEVIYLYHARYLADGELSVPAPPVPEAFSIYMIPFKSARWYSVFPPGWPAVLTVGVVLGLPWLINPLLAGVNVILAYLLFQELYSRRFARIAVLLLCVSPWQIFMAMNFMSHTATLSFALLAAVAMARARKTEKSKWGLIAGLAIGAVSLIRPPDGLVMMGLLGLWGIGLGGQRLKLSSISAFFLGVIVSGGLILPYNKLITGNAMLSPLTAYYEQYYGPKVFALGFGPGRGLGWPLDAFPGHSPFEALINASLNIFSINIELFGWGTGSLFIIALLVLGMSKRRSDYLMLAVIAAVFIMYSLFWYSGGPDFGARYWYLALIPCVALTVTGIQALQRRLELTLPANSDCATRMLAGIVVLSILAFVNFFPWRAIDKYHRYLNMSPDLQYLAKTYGFGKSVVLIRGYSHPDYACAWMLNPLDPQASATIYAWDKDIRSRSDVLRAYSDRPVWLVDGPTVTGGGFKVAEGPLRAEDLIVAENALARTAD